MWRQRNLGPYCLVALCFEDHLHLQQNMCGVGIENSAKSEGTCHPHQAGASDETKQRLSASSLGTTEVGIFAVLLFLPYLEQGCRSELWCDVLSCQWFFLSCWFGMDACEPRERKWREGKMAPRAHGQHKREVGLSSQERASETELTISMFHVFPLPSASSHPNTY